MFAGKLLKTRLGPVLAALQLLMETIASPARPKMHIHVDAQLIYRRSVNN